MEEVEGSNPSRSTKIPQTFTGLVPPKFLLVESNWSPTPINARAPMGTVCIAKSAHNWVCIFTAIHLMGTVGTEFRACCLLETTTIIFPIRMLPSAPAGEVGPQCDLAENDAFTFRFLSASKHNAPDALLFLESPDKPDISGLLY
jgi:hypothetical protein